MPYGTRPTTTETPPMINKWQSMAINGTQWQSPAIIGTQWHSVALSGTQWQSMALA